MMGPMNESLVGELQRIDASPAVLPHAMRYFVAAQSGDLPPARMRDELLAAGVDSDGVDRAVGLLQRDPALMEAAALAVLQAGWEDPARRELAAGALGAAGAKLPVVEVALISIVAVYGLWLTATKGRRSHEHIVRRGRDGSWEESEKTEWYGPSGPLEAIADVIGLRPSAATTDELPDSGHSSLPPVPDET